MTTRTCSTCRATKPEAEFYRYNQCKVCTREKAAKYREENRDRIRAHNRKVDPLRKARMRGFSPKYRAEKPERCAAHRAVRLALNSGELTRQPCEKCGNPKTDAHHEDYSRPLTVRWLCRVHHAEAHRTTTTPAASASSSPP